MSVVHDTTTPVPSFHELGVPPSIIDALAQRGIDVPFEIQAATIADILDGRDVCGRAPTGSGKTLAFGIPLVVTTERAAPRRPRSLVLAPTRELANQIHDEVRTFAGSVRVGVVYGGVGYGPQLNALRKGVDILVACPGRLEDLIEQGQVDLSEVDAVVLDEADRMADMGFIPAVRRILDQTDPERQTILFSATLDGDVATLTRDYQHDPVRHEVGDETPDITSATHLFWKVARGDRRATTGDVIDAAWPAIVFCRTRHGADRLAKQLGRTGIEAAAIHGGRSQGQRTRALEAFSRGRVQALIATDVAARGIHVDGVASVVHYDPPEDHKTYVHRSGRTARAGADGLVVSMLQPEQVNDAVKMQRRIGLDEPVTRPDLDEVAMQPGTAPKPRPVSRDDESTPHNRSNNSKRGQNGAGKGRRRKGGATAGRDRQRGPKPIGEAGSNPAPKKKKGAGKNKKRHRDQPAARQAAKNKGKRRTNTSADTGSSNGNGRPNRKARRAHLQPNAGS